MSASPLEAVIIGAGPYGLSIAAHLRRLGIPFRIFGKPMDSWASHMPKGMFLKSDGFASNIYDPKDEFTLKRYCSERGIEYADLGTPVSLQTFIDYGMAFKDSLVPELEERLVKKITRSSEGFRLEVEGGETFAAKRVILAVGITHFAQIPANLQHLPHEFLTHCFEHSDLRGFRGRSVAIVGSGASAIDTAVLLSEAGADVQLIARSASLRFHEKTSLGKPRSIWQRLRSPLSGLGPGLKARFYADAPNLFWFLPESLRLKTVRNSFGPAGGWFIKDKLVGKVPLVLGATIQKAEIAKEGVRLTIISEGQAERKLQPQHIIAATGYRVDLERLAFICPHIRQQVKTADSSPILSSTFESSERGLYFVGLAAANSFGPVMRFAYGAGFTATQLTEIIAKSASQGRAMTTVPHVKQISTAKPETAAQVGPALSRRVD